MKIRLSAGILVPLVVAAVGCAPSYDYEADAAAIEAMREAEEAALVAGDVDATMALFSSDAMLMLANEPPFVGADAIREWVEALTEGMTISFESYETEDVRVSGDLAVEYYTGVWTMTPLDGSDPVTENNKGLHVYERQEDGSWLIIYDMANSNDPLPGM
jgi:uncharacterized protein (TIGR02246 family)